MTNHHLVIKNVKNETKREGEKNSIRRKLEHTNDARAIFLSSERD
jgi:hypothetical protein